MNNMGGSKTDTVVKLSLFFFISLFSFSVGTFVGKQVSDNERRRLAYEAEYEESRKMAAADEARFGGDEKVSEADVDSLAEEFIKAEVKKADGQAEMKEEAPAVAEVKTIENKEEADEDGFKKVERSTASTPKNLPEQKPAAMNPDKEMAKNEDKPIKKGPKMAVVDEGAKRVAKGEAPMKTPAPVKKLAGVLPKISPSSRGKYTVQVSSYSTEMEAKKHSDKLKSKGYSAFYVSAKVKDKVWYRVSVGLFDSRKTANNFKRELMKQANIKTAIIQKIVK